MAVQLGGSDPKDLAEAARICADFGYDEINLNVGCPSDRVQYGRFGACLMQEPALVGECVAAMKAAVSLPVTVKCRIGVDDQDTEEALTASPIAWRGRLRRAHGPCPQGLAAGPVARRRTGTSRRSTIDRVYRLKPARPDLTVASTAASRRCLRCTSTCSTWTA